ncbi:MAG: radical SAM protein [Thermodesulfobacteriota bacterium]
MFVFIEPVSKNIGMYVPAYPLPLMEIAGYVSSRINETEIKIISMPMDYGLPLTPAGRDHIHRQLLDDLTKLDPAGIGISCTAISQAEEVIHLCEMIKKLKPDLFIFVGGYFPTIYYEEIFSRTSAIDVIVRGEGEIPALELIRDLEKGRPPRLSHIPGLVWKHNQHIEHSASPIRFNLRDKAPLNLDLLKHPGEYDILPYAFSRGCPYQCNFCMEDYIRPHRREVPRETVKRDLQALVAGSSAHTLLVSDALFKSFDLFPFFEQLGLKINFETRCDVMDPDLIPRISASCGMLVLGFESASYGTLRRMNKVRDRAHYEKYIANTLAIFKQATENHLPIMVFMIGGYPGDTEADLKESLAFARKLSEHKGPGGHVFKIGECHVYPRTKIYELALSLGDVVFDDDGVFGQNVVREPSKGLNFETVLAYNKEIFDLSNLTPKLQSTFLNMMPLFRLPVKALNDPLIPESCYSGKSRTVLDVKGQSLATLKKYIPKLARKYKKEMSDQRTSRQLKI